MQGKNTLPLLIVLYCSAFIAGFNENLMNMALISIMNEYAVDSVTAQWLVTAYMIVATVVVMCMAFLYQRFKLKPLFIVSAALTLAGSVMGLFAMNFAFLMAARFVQALGSGVFIPLMMNTVLAVTPKNKLGSFLSIGGCTITFGPALAPVVCGAFVTAFGWHSIFIVPTVAMACLLIVGFVFVRNLENTPARLDIPSVILSAIFLSSLSFGLAELTLQPVVAGISLAVAVLSAIVFVVQQLRCDHPLINLEPMRFITFWPTIVLVIIAMMTTFSLSVLLPLYLEGSLGLTAFMAGMVILIPVLLNAGSTLVGGRLMDKYGEWPLLPLGFACMALGLAFLAQTSSAESLTLTFGSALIAYMGVGLVFSPSQTAGLRTLPPRLNPHGVALTTTFVQIAACIGPSMYIGIMSSTQASAILAGSTAESGAAIGFGQAILVATLIAIVGFITALVYSIAALKRKKAAKATESERQAAQPAVLATLMETNPFTIHATDPVENAMRAFIDLKIGGMPVVDDKGQGVGYISDGDIMRYLADQHSIVSGAYTLIEVANAQNLDERLRELATLPVSDIATNKLVSITADASLKDACEMLAQHKFKKVPVVEKNRIVGTVNRSDVIRYAMERYLYAIPR